MTSRLSSHGNPTWNECVGRAPTHVYPHLLAQGFVFFAYLLSTFSFAILRSTFDINVTVGRGVAEPRLAQAAI